MAEKKRTIEIEAAVPRDYNIEYWYRKPQDMPESEQEHVKALLEEGYTSGELIDNENYGWWSVITE